MTDRRDVDGPPAAPELHLDGAGDAVSCVVVLNLLLGVPDTVGLLVWPRVAGQSDVLTPGLVAFVAMTWIVYLFAAWAASRRRTAGSSASRLSGSRTCELDGPRGTGARLGGTGG
jgi:hypothetical protein